MFGWGFLHRISRSRISISALINSKSVLPVRHFYVGTGGVWCLYFCNILAPGGIGYFLWNEFSPYFIEIKQDYLLPSNFLNEVDLGVFGLNKSEVIWSVSSKFFSLARSYCELDEKSVPWVITRKVELLVTYPNMTKKFDFLHISISRTVRSIPYNSMDTHPPSPLGRTSFDLTISSCRPIQRKRTSIFLC